MATGSQNNTSFQAQKWTNLRAFTIGNTAKDVDGTAAISWSKDEILGASTNAYFLRGDKAWSNTLNGAFTANGNITANGGYLYSTLNGNTVQIGSQNSSYTHFTNSKDIPFWFNKVIWSDGGFTIYNTGSNHWRNGYLQVNKSDGGDCYIEICRAANADWRILNSGGNLFFQNNWTSAKGSYFNVLQLDFNTGIITVVKGDLKINQNLRLYRNSGVGVGRIHFYSTYKTWSIYMSNAAASACPSGGTPSTLGDVTNWALRSYIEDSAGYGWIWESAAESNTGTPTARMALNANNGNLTLAGNLVFTNSGTAFRGINYGTMGDNDQWRIGGAATAANAGYMEIATADDGNEPIYVRQYTGVFTTVKRTLTLLDASGHTALPGNLTMSGGVITLWGERYNGNYGLNCNNSDIIGVNSIRTADNAETYGEGLMFKNGSGWDCMAASGGAFYFRSATDGTPGLSQANSTASLYAANFYGALKGNADTATKATQDGSGNTITNKYFQIYNTSYQGNSSAVTVNDLASQGPAYGMINAATDNPAGSATWVHVLNMGWSKVNTSWIGQIALNTNGATMYFRGNGSSAISGKGWNTVLSSNNYTSYTVTKTGSGASGSWGISVTGSSASCTGNSATATKLSNTPNNTNTFLRGDNTWTSTINNTIICIPLTSNMAASNMAFNGGIQVRESGGVGNGQSAIEYGPRISFHWSNRVAKSITLHSDGTFYFRDQNGTTKSYINANLVGDITGNAATASKLGTATVGGANRGIYLNAGTATAVSWYYNSCSISGGNTANYPWHRFATCTTGTGQWTDKTVIVVIHSRYDNGPCGMVKLSMRTNATNAAKSTSAVWIYRRGFSVDDIKISTPTKTTGTDETISAYIKCGAYPRRIAYILEGSNLGWSLVSSNEPNDTTASDKKGGTEINASVSGSNAIDGATVSYANSAGSSASCTGNATTCSYPLGFASRGTGETWGNTTGTGIANWGTSTGGAIAFRNDNPSSGKLSIKVDGRFYGNEGTYPAMLMRYENSYWGLCDPDAANNVWIRTTTQGIIPYQSGGKGSGHCGLGTSSWYFSTAYIDTITSNKTYGAVWNDIAECRKTITKEPGRVVVENKSGIMELSSIRMQATGRIISDTYGYCMGEPANDGTPIAIAGRVLVYPYRKIEEYNLGDCVCAAPDGTVDIMTREEIKEYPDRIIGIVSEIPTYKIWSGGAQNGKDDIQVNGRIWIYVR